MPNWKKLIVSGSDAVLNSLSVNNGITGSLLGTASNATQATSASFATTASFYGGSVTSASYASTASNVQGGAANYISLFNTATTLSSSQIFDNGTNVGIGTASPNEKLTVNGNINITNNAQRYIYLDTDNTGTGRLNIQAGGGSSAYGGAINLFSNANTTKPGWVIYCFI